MNDTRYELDARMTPTSHGVFVAYDTLLEATRHTAALVAQGFGWVRVQKASVWSNSDMQPVTIFERGEA